MADKGAAPRPPKLPDGRTRDDRAYLRTTLLAARLLGFQVRIARLKRGWPEAELAERARISRATLQKIETGQPAVALGLVLEVCSALGISMTGDPLGDVQDGIERARLELAALPKRVRGPRKTVVDDDF